MKKLMVLFLFLIFTVVAGIYWFYSNSKPVSNIEKFEHFVIAKGSSASQIGSKLESEGLIKSGLAFKIYMQFSGQSGKIQTGEFKLTPSYSLVQTVNTLFEGPLELWVTVPEGLRREEVVQKFASVLDKDASFVTSFLSETKGEEGYLFPDTYLFPRDASASIIVEKMIETFDSKTKGLKNNSNLSLKEVVILASLLERETRTDTERPIVAGILIKRLNSEWPLQIDAAVQYAVASSKCESTNIKCDWWPILTLEDLSIGSAFNTYKNQGLPPAPIASPGLSSIKAVFNPVESDYWYYIHDNKGQIHYAKTLSDHNSNITRFLGK